VSNIHTFSDRDRIEQEAREWLIRLDSDTEPSAEEVRALRAWVARSPAHRQELLRISAFWNDANILTELSIPLETTTQSVASRLRRFFAPLMSVNRCSALAASLVLAVTIGAVSLVVMQPSDATNGIYVTAIGGIQERKLVDGSILKINTDSQVQVDYSDNVRKIRLLRGEAHFQVSHNANWPFEVYAGTRMVKAIGTAFSVQLSNDSVQVTVSEGRVDIAAAVAKQQRVLPLSVGLGLICRRQSKLR
jgi:transmembrane sensor